MHEKIIIHDSIARIEGWFYRNGWKKWTGIERWPNEHFLTYNYDDVSFVCSYTGCCQTSRLIEKIANEAQREDIAKENIKIIKVGTASGLQPFEKGNLLLVSGALQDEGTTQWIETVEKLKNLSPDDIRSYCSEYFQNRQIVKSPDKFRKKFGKFLRVPSKHPLVLQEGYLWTVDSYDNFNNAYKLWSYAIARTFSCKVFDPANPNSSFIKDIELSGAEQECSALFAICHSRGIDNVAALVVISFTLQELIESVRELLDKNSEEPKLLDTILENKGLKQTQSNRESNKEEVWETEMQCLDRAFEFLKK